MNSSKLKAMTMDARKPAAPRRLTGAVPAHPDYQDEITPAQIEVIRRLADPDGLRAAKRVLLYPSLL
jgi:hypothetical protein